MDAFRAGSGRYHLESQEHFEDYLKAIGNLAIFNESCCSQLIDYFVEHQFDELMI